MVGFSRVMSWKIFRSWWVSSRRFCSEMDSMKSCTDWLVGVVLFFDIGGLVIGDAVPVEIGVRGYGDSLTVGVEFVFGLGCLGGAFVEDGIDVVAVGVGEDVHIGWIGQVRAGDIDELVY